MIYCLTGKIIKKTLNAVVLSCGGVGYFAQCPASVAGALPGVGKDATIYTVMSVTENDVSLYGFATEEEYELFLQLIGVSGIGPKVALGILSAITVESLCRAIQNKQASVLTKLPGIGKKSAERLILELKDKVAFADSGEEELLTIENEAEVGDDAVAEAMAALQSLGYTQAEIAPVIRKTAKYKTTEAIIKESLKALSHM